MAHGRPSLLVAIMVTFSVLAVAADATAPTYVIQASRSSVAGVVVGRAKPESAIRRFGQPATTNWNGSSCLYDWPQIGLKIVFWYHDPKSNPCELGEAARATVTSRSAWRTTVGLRVGDSVARLRKLYPRASASRASKGEYWLYVRRNVCSPTSAYKYPSLVAHTRSGLVTSLIAESPGGCE
jgi:hypothetical protein